VESDTTSSSLDRSVSFEVIPTMTQHSDQVTEHDDDDDEDQGQAMGDVQDSTAVERIRRNPCNPVGSLLT